MFGMLDYRAHKLYWILFIIPNIILSAFAIFGLPLINYTIGLELAENRIFQILISLVSLFIVEIIWLMIIFGPISKLFQFVFSLFVDVIPHDGRTKEEAQLVVWNGEEAIRALAINKHPSTWTDDLINSLPKDDWVVNWFFKDDIIRRFDLIQTEYSFRSEDSPYNDYEVTKILEQNDMVMGRLEKYVTTPTIRASIYSYSVFLLLIIYNPFA